MLFQPLEIPGHHSPCVWLQTGLLVELAVEGGLVLQFLNLSQQSAVVTVRVPEENGIVVEHIGLWVTIRPPVDGYTAGAYGVEDLFGNVSLNKGILWANVELVLLEEFGFVVVEAGFQFVSVVEEFPCTVDGGEGVKTPDQSCTPLCPRVVWASVAGDQGAEAATHGGVPFLVAQLVADVLDVLLGRIWREHLQYPQGKTHVSWVVSVVEAETEVDGFMVEEVVQVWGESWVMVVLAVEVDAYILSALSNVLVLAPAFKWMCQHIKP